MADTTNTIWKSPQDRYRWPSATPVAFRCHLDEAQSAKLLERLADLPIKLLYGCCWEVVREESWFDAASGNGAHVLVSVSTRWTDVSRADATVGIRYPHAGGEILDMRIFWESGEWRVGNGGSYTILN